MRKRTRNNAEINITSRIQRFWLVKSAVRLSNLLPLGDRAIAFACKFVSVEMRIENGKWRRIGRVEFAGDVFTVHHEKLPPPGPPNEIVRGIWFPHWGIVTGAMLLIASIVAIAIAC